MWGLLAPESSHDVNPPGNFSRRASRAENKGGGVLRGWRGSYPELEFRKIIVKRKVNTSPLVFRQNPGDLETNNSPSFPRWESSIRMQGRGVIRDRWCTAAKGPNVLCSSTGGNGPANSFDPESVKNYLDFSPGGLPGVSEHCIPLLYPPPAPPQTHYTPGRPCCSRAGSLGLHAPMGGWHSPSPSPRGGEEEEEVARAIPQGIQQGCMHCNCKSAPRRYPSA